MFFVGILIVALAVIVFGGAIADHKKREKRNKELNIEKPINDWLKGIKDSFK